MTQATQALLLEAMEKTADGIGIYDPNDRIIYANRSCAEFFGMSPDQILGQSFAASIRHAYTTGKGVNVETDDIDAWLAMAFQKRRRQRYRSFQTDTRDGRWVQLTEQMTDGDYLFMFFTDITEQKRIEAKLQRLSAKLRFQADTDDLTGINNRRNFLRLAHKAQQRCRHAGKDCTLLLMDLDFFKRINDAYGHQMGDRVLVNISSALSAELRPYDVLGRLGGEEFAALIPEAGLERAHEVAERLRRAVEATVHSNEWPDLRVTLSVGIAFNAGAKRELDALISQADQALYKAKHEGRNRCKIGGASPE
ncbi:sensor domain-containing diguanylate cyclase [Motiliproteus sp. SC1-56]|uniref:sensor domain-containing diguanylate cyclase n=1 Tax=Motiliproteus sp. SC1-56 TaxID=2799565 RepID=UPI001A90219C